MFFCVVHSVLIALIRLIFFFQAADGIRARNVTGVQTCALPILLMAIRAAFSMGVDMAGQGRLMVIDKVSIINPLPASYESQLKTVDGVTDTPHANWFGGYYKDVRNQFATFAVDPESWLRVYSKEYDLPEAQKKTWYADRTGAIVGIDTAKKYGFKVGQHVPINGTVERWRDGGPWEFTIDGIYDSEMK